MKNHVRFASLLLLIATLLAFGSTAAMAGTVVYNNGVPNGEDAWTINFGFWVEDSFLLTHSTTLTQVEFAAWLFPGDALTKVQWTIFPAGAGVGMMHTGTANVFGLGACGTNCEEESFSLPSLTLPAGTYYLRLQNAVVTNGDPAYWAESGGKSTAYQGTTVGTIPSESFQVIE